MSFFVSGRTQRILGDYLPNLNVACLCTNCFEINVYLFCEDLCQYWGLAPKLDFALVHKT